MTETQSHRINKRKAAGKMGRTEVPLPGGRRLDALSRGGKRATEIERSSHRDRLKLAIQRLRASKAKQKVLRVPQKNFTLAVEAMKKHGLHGTVSNLSGSKTEQI